MIVIHYYVLALVILAGAIIGFIFGRWFKKEPNIEPCGVLHVETSDPDGPYLFLELDRAHTPEQIMKESEVIFVVDNKSYLTMNEQ